MKRITHLLIDLDGVLIHSSQKQVQAKVIVRMYRILLRHFSFLKSIKILRAMGAGLGRGTSRKKIFERITEEFVRETGWTSERSMAFLESLFVDSFRAAESEFTPDPQAFAFLHEAQKKYKLVLITNPVLIESCLDLKLSWTGVDQFSFLLKTHAQNCAYRKPDPKYFEECLNMLGVNSESCWVIGDREDREGIARELGFRVSIIKNADFWPFQLQQLKADHSIPAN